MRSINKELGYPYKDYDAKHQYEGANAPDYEKTDPSLKESVYLLTDKSGSLFCQTAKLQALRVVAQLCRTQNCDYVYRNDGLTYSKSDENA